MAPSSPTTTAVGWPGCSSTRTPTRSACPTRACRSSTRSSTSGPTPWPNGPTPRGSTSRRCCAPTTCPLFSVDTHRPAGRVRPAGLQPVGRARLHEPAQLHRPGRRAGPGRRAAARATRWSWPAATAPTTPSRWPTSSTSSCWATARRWWARSPRWWPTGRRRAAPRARASRCCARLAAVPGVYVPVDVRGRPTRASTWPAVTPRYPDVPAQVEKRTVADLADWPYPKRQLVPAHRGGARPAQRRGVPGLHPGLPVLPGGHDHPSGARAAGRRRSAP